MTLDLFQKEDQHTNGPVTVLGKTFANDEERRAYFREELRKKLPELKEIEGFPIGEDEDIINLSDPPFYTACPNPWINDFIAEWEEEKKQLEKEGKRVPDFEVTEPYAADIFAKKNNIIYNAHSYHTKVPYEIILNFILYYTQPGDIIYDGFAGTGMTGVASNQSESLNLNKYNDIKSYFQELNYSANKLGKRFCIQNDLSPIASFITHNHTHPVNIKEFEVIANKIYDEVFEKYGNLYTTNYLNSECQINYVIWSENLVCPSCSSNFNYWNTAVKNHTKVLDVFECPKCGNKLKKSKGGDKNIQIADKYFETVYDNLVDDVVKKYSLEPVVLNITYKGKRLNIDIQETDILKIKELEKIDLEVSKYRMPEGDESRRNDKFGFLYTSHFYSKRNLIIINEFYKLINNYNGGLKQYLLKWFTSSLNRLTLFNRYAPNHNRHVGPMANTLYISGTPTEINAFYFFKEKIKENLLDIDLSYNAVNQIGSATNVSNIPQNSVDFVFTDPPFGANIMYSELNYINESWLKVFTNNKQEAICNKTQLKGFSEYQNLMLKSFKEYYRLLKPGKWMIVEFSNTSASIWNAIQTSISQAGFIISQVFALNKGRAGLMGIIGDVAVNQDLVISCYKPSSEFDTKFQQSQHSPMGVWDFVEEHLSHLPIHLVKDNATTAVVERSAKILFDRLIAFYVQRSLPVPIDAGKFQEGLKERFVERDGMYFTQEQVEEYERKKAEVPEFIQMSLFVGSEQDAVYWLRQLLEKEPKTEQDLHPLWMREVAGNMRKGDTLPEMRQILEENFLKDDTGKWYVPDAENEADLEKLRNKRLLKIFEDYKTEAAKPKGKLKEVRVEALRVGFKQCYQDKDFKTIVTIGDRIPNNLLMEDEVLLQFYDIAAAKI